MSLAAPKCPSCGLDMLPGTLVCPNDGTEISDAGGREPTVRRDPLVGLKLGDYVVKDRIGTGGMGFVYEGVQPLIGKKVAIKILRGEFAEDPVQMQRLLDEARAVNAIRHRGIIDIFNFGELIDGRQYIVMEYLAGKPLDVVVHERGALPAPEALQILEEVLSALAAAHGAGVIHRDLKPSNIFVVSQPDGSRYVKLLDFGLAKQTAVGSSSQARMTQIVGTPEYMAPEQARGGTVGPYTDIYSLGVVAFELLTGRIPFEGPTAIDIAMQHIEKVPPTPSSFESSVPLDLEHLILRMMAKTPRERPQTAELVRSEVKRMARDLMSSSTQVKGRISLEGTPTARASQPREGAPAARNPNTPTRSALEPAVASAPLGLKARRVRAGVGMALVALLAGAGVVSWRAVSRRAADDDGTVPIPLATPRVEPPPPAATARVDVPPRPAEPAPPAPEVTATVSAVTPPAVDPAPPRPPRVSKRPPVRTPSAPASPAVDATSRSALLARIEADIRALHTQKTDQDEEPPGMAFLNRWREAVPAADEGRRKELVGKLSKFEHDYLHQ